jgi:hypothetical protein
LAGYQLVARPLPVHKHRKTHTHTQTLNIHALGGIRTHDPDFRASEDSACLRPLGYRDWGPRNFTWMKMVVSDQLTLIPLKSRYIVLRIEFIKCDVGPQRRSGSGEEENCLHLTE